MTITRVTEYRDVVIYERERKGERGVPKYVAYHSRRAVHMEEFRTITQARAWLERYKAREERKRI
jgi:hypothetical protein